jgi:hypothetical protein
VPVEGSGTTVWLGAAVGGTATGWLADEPMVVPASEQAARHSATTETVGTIRRATIDPVRGPLSDEPSLTTKVGQLLTVAERIGHFQG